MARYRYEPLAKVASGGTATVYLGATRRGGLGDLVALKRPHAHILEDARQRAEVLREARVAESLHHPNVVRVREVEADGHGLQLVMDYVEGVSLGWLIAEAAGRGARIPPRVAFRVLLDACEGLAAVHAQTDASGRLLGLVHRDVSPQNILVGVDGRARLTDFGLAKAVYAGAPSTTQGTLKGKLGYMAPEYVRHGTVDRSVDVFAMGVVLWESLAGLRLFRGDNEGQTLDRLLRDEASPLDVVDATLTPFDPLVARATAKDPVVRTESAEALRDGVEAVARAAGLVGSREEVGAYVREIAGGDLDRRRAEVASVLRARRRPRIAASAALAAVVLGGAALFTNAQRTSGSAPSASAPSALPAQTPMTPLAAPDLAPVRAAAASSASSLDDRPKSPPTTLAPPARPRPAAAPRASVALPALPPNPYRPP